jgi:quercetin dioxygenase-like cupin family protein
VGFPSIVPCKHGAGRSYRPAFVATSPCSHLDQARVTELPEPLLGCEECLKSGTRWFHLRMCLTCGKVGCCDNSSGRHATAHFHETGHPLVRSAEPGEEWAWCYADGVGLALSELGDRLPAVETTWRTADLVPALDGSALALTEHEGDPGATLALYDPERDTLLFVVRGSGSLAFDGGSTSLGSGSAALVLADEEATLEAGENGLTVLRATVGPEADRHAPIGPRELVTSLETAGAEKATGARSFQVLFGPHNGSTRATLFAGFIPPGKAPWHYHLYDEIVWVPRGPGRLHIGDTATELGPGSTFRLRPRQVHIVENRSDSEMTVIGIFTPAGSPSAAFLEPDIAAEYRFSG